MSKTFRNITLRLTSPINVVDLSYLKLDEPVKKLKVRFLSYISQNVDVESLLIDIKGWNDNSTYLTGLSNKAYTFIMPLVQQTQTQNFYLDKDISGNATFDIIKEVGSRLGSLEIHCLINNQYRPTEINSSSPVIIELFFSTE